MSAAPIKIGKVDALPGELPTIHPSPVTTTTTDGRTALGWGGPEGSAPAGQRAANADTAGNIAKTDDMPARPQCGSPEREILRGDPDTGLTAIKEALRAWLISARTPPAPPCRRSATPASTSSGNRPRRPASNVQQGFAAGETSPSWRTGRGTARKPCRQWHARQRPTRTR